MRQRKVKNEGQRLAAVAKYMLGSRAEWDEKKKTDRLDRVYLELGCGRGHFLVDLAKEDPAGMYIGAEGRSSIVLRALERIHQESLENAVCIPVYITSVEEWFSTGELSGIYLNFSDPWPKARHEKRRLTHRSYMEGYRKILKPDGFVACKTDSDPLFQFTLEEAKIAGFHLEEAAEDLHGTSLAAREPMTQYERRFLALGHPVRYCRFRLSE